MKRLLALMALVTVCASTTGCFHEQIIMNPNYNANVTTPDVSETQITVIGLVNVSGDVDLKATCQNGVDRASSKVLFDLGIVAFRKAEVFCTK